MRGVLVFALAHHPQRRRGSVTFVVAQAQRFRRWRVTFLCKRPKKSNQKKGRFPDTAVIAAWSASGFFYATSCRGEKRRTSMCAALRVCGYRSGSPSLEAKGWCACGRLRPTQGLVAEPALLNCSPAQPRRQRHGQHCPAHCHRARQCAAALRRASRRSAAELPAAIDGAVEFASARLPAGRAGRWRGAMPVLRGAFHPRRLTTAAGRE